MIRIVGSKIVLEISPISCLKRHGYPELAQQAMNVFGDGTVSLFLGLDHETKRTKLRIEGYDDYENLNSWKPEYDKLLELIKDGYEATQTVTTTKKLPAYPQDNLVPVKRSE